MRRPCRAVPAVAVAVVALAVAGCGDGGGGGGGRSLGTRDSPVTAFTIVAEDSRWDLSRVVAPAGREVTVTVDNRDSGVGHNLRVELDTGSASTELEAGPVRQTLRFTIERPGEHEFRCDPHPRMTGIVEAV